MCAIMLLELLHRICENIYRQENIQEDVCTPSVLSHFTVESLLQYSPPLQSVPDPRDSSKPGRGKENLIQQVFIVCHAHTQCWVL